MSYNEIPEPTNGKNSDVIENMDDIDMTGSPTDEDAVPVQPSMYLK